jgi:hypothetical protein
MSWALWLAAPAGATVLAALWSWWRGLRARGPRRVTTRDAMRAHEQYLDALTRPARSADRGPDRPRGSHSGAG